MSTTRREVDQTSQERRRSAYLVNHVFFPPQLPGGDDWDADLESHLLSTLRTCLSNFLHHVGTSQHAAVASARDLAARTYEAIGPNKDIDAKNLSAVLQDMCQCDGAIALDICCQNSGVMISRKDRSVCIEAFELSPQNKTVMASPGRLRRQFPDVAVSVSLDKFMENAFRENLAHTLSTMCQQPAPGTTPRVEKAHEGLDENRDTRDPMWVTEWLFSGVLGPESKPGGGQSIQKNVRDSILWNDSEKPWRRSRTWLLARVAMQLTFSRHSPEGKGIYKSFMLFFAATFLDETTTRHLSSDHIAVMIAKVARRRLKLVGHGASIEKSIERYVDEAMSKATAELQRRQQRIFSLSSPYRDHPQLEHLDPYQDVSHRLPVVDGFLKSIGTRTQSLTEADFDRKSYPEEFEPGCLPSLSRLSPSYAAFTLAAFEKWVAEHLDCWIAANAKCPDTCRRLLDLMRAYKGIASGEYRMNPEGASCLALTALELWIACDKSATALEPLLRKYDPHVPAQLLQSSILPFREQMSRLAKAELYLEERERAANSSLPDIFQSFGAENSFAVQYYLSSQTLQQLYCRIVEDATGARNAKVAELNRLQSKYRDLKGRYDNLSCEYRQVWNPRRRRHSLEHAGCSRCQLEQEMDGVRIYIHEWPLPLKPHAAFATVFELRPPHHFSAWREATAFLFLNVLNGNYNAGTAKEVEDRLEQYWALSVYGYSQGTEPGITLASSTKPNARTHRNLLHVLGLTEHDVCLNNGMTWAYYDSAKTEYTKRVEFDEETPRRYIYSLPTEMRWLEKHLFRPSYRPQGLDPNQAIANQHETPDSMSLPEFNGLASVLSQHKLQWMNILCEAASPCIDFRKDETSVVLFQAMYQAGPPTEGSDLREGHQVLNDAEFCHKLAAALHEAAGRIKQNWESSQALANFVYIASRALTLSSEPDVHRACLRFLREARGIAYNWLKLVRAKSHDIKDNDFRLELFGKIAEIALICVATFDVEERHLQSLLSGIDDASILVQCSISCQECLTADDLRPQGTLLSLMILRWERVCSRARAHLTGLFTAKGLQENALDNAIHNSWPEYSKGGCWQPLSHPIGHWLETATAPIHGRSLKVMYNLLTAELLVNGLPLARLPREYEGYRLYRQLFGNAILDIMPTNVPGMQFGLKAEVSGYTVSMGLSDSYGLLVCATRSDPETTYHIVPEGCFRGSLPLSFVEEYTHWYNTAEDIVEFRPVRSSWKQGEDALRDGWTLSRRDAGTWELRKGARLLVSRGSKTEKEISKVLQPIEETDYLHVCLDKTQAHSGGLDIEVPRLRLQFSLQPGRGKLVSRQFRDMWVDHTSQSFGALMGLRSKLVLVNSHGSRMILVPDGEITWTRTGNAAGDSEDIGHVSVYVTKGTSSVCRAYQVDSELGRLVDDGSFRGKIYLAYLHALTSYPIPDPLTAHTGTELALSILRSAAVRSLFQPSEPDLELLVLISRLTPIRTFYPDHLKEMQRVEWLKDIGFLAQHSQLRLSVKALLEQADLQAALYSPDSRSDFVSRLPRLTESLLEYDLVASAWCRTAGFGAEDFTTAHDRIYSGGRGHNWEVSRANACYGTSGIILLGKPCLSTALESGHLQAALWQCFLPAGTVKGPTHPLPSFDHDGVDFTWLHENNTVLYHVCRLHLMLSGGKFTSRHRVMSWLSSMVFAANVQVRSSTEPLFELPILRMLEAFIVVPEMAQIIPPRFDSFPVGAGHEFIASTIKNIAERGARDYHRCPESSLPRYAQWESDLDLSRRRTTAYQEMVDSLVTELVSLYRMQWPCHVPTPPSEAKWRTYFDMDEIQGEVRDMFASWFANRVFYEYLGKIAQVMLRLHIAPPAVAQEPHVKFAHNRYTSIKGFVSADDIFGNHKPPQVSLLGPRPSFSLPTRVEGLVRRIQARASSDFEKRYADDLERSVHALRNHLELSPVAPQGLGQVQEALRIYSPQCRSYRDKLHDSLATACATSGSCLRSTASLPRICAQFFLSQLAVSRWKTIPASWKPALIQYGLAHHDVLRAERLLALASDRSLNDLAKELRNTPHQNWTPEEYPFALLMEVESNITIRKVQIDIARQMIDPPNDRNSVMQLNMGEGKSTVIVPTVAAAEVANGNRLVRVIVAKAQAPQMRQMLLSKLGGLLDIKIHQLPFSRELRLDATQVPSIAQDLQACRDEGGVLLVQPEHLLSFKLMGLEFLINGETSISQELIKTQCFLESTSRDIVDESDENFSVKFELVYTMGTQRPIDFSPDRWHLLLDVLAAVKDVAPAVAQKKPRSCAISNRNGSGSFSRFRVFNQEAQNCLVHAVAERICETGLPGLPIARQDEGSRAALFTYMTKQDLTPQEIAAVEIPGARSFWSESTKRPLLLLRGLLAGGILGFVFSKRWRVNYGFDQARNPPTRLAVPYRAKDCPSARSEFSHPEVVMLLTALSSYYGGLSDDELFLAFTHLLKSDQPEQDYDAWVRDADSMDSSFKHLNGVNIKDHGQCTQQIFPRLRYSKAAIDFFLSRVVYPKFMKEFPSKLSASGWDIGERKVHPTTGFSGTNDSRELLPLSVCHLDLPDQKHTNGLVLEYLLRDENSVVSIPPRRGSPASDAELLLSLVVDMSDEVQVILDVGAQILELGNAEVARQWLKMETEANSHRGRKACVFVNEKDELHVVDLKGHAEPLQTSPFYHQLDVCLVFLDEAHTRGTDLKLPDHYRAALTLGANLTKDRLAQAAMRMRKLGKGQSITFCVPQEIEASILQQRVGKGSIKVMDVLEWAIQETFLDTHRSIPLWAVQGRRHAHQKSIYSQTGGGQMTQDLASKLLEDEAQTIDDLYRPGDRVAKPCCPETDRHPGVDRILDHCAKFGSVHMASAALHEEQERELSPEIEEERHVEKPKPAEPARHQIDPAVRQFVQTGEIPAFSEASHPCFPSAWTSLARTSAAAIGDASLRIHEFPADVRTTRDFARTIQTPSSAALGGAKTQLDQYQRAVRWILTSTRARGGDDDAVHTTMVLISPFEAQGLLEEIAAHGKVVLHLYAPRSTMAFRPLDHLLLHARPAPPPTWTCPLRLRALLNVFAGQLFMSSHDEYKAVCDMFGLAWKGGLGDGVFVHADGFIDPASREEVAGTDGNEVCAFTQSPVPFLKVLMTKIRRDCESIDKTHVGMMLNGVLLREEDFQSPESDLPGANARARYACFLRFL